MPWRPLGMPMWHLVGQCAKYDKEVHSRWLAQVPTARLLNDGQQDWHSLVLRS